MPIRALKMQGVTLIGSRWEHCFAITECNDLYMWGLGASGQLGIGIGSQAAPVPVRELRGLIRGASVGQGHTAAFDLHGRLYTWGKNDKGQLGLQHLLRGDRVQQVEVLAHEKVRRVQCGANFTFVMCQSGKVRACSARASGLLSVKTIDVASSSVRFSCSIFLFLSPSLSSSLSSLASQVYTMGSGQHGALGMGNEVNIKSPGEVISLRNSGIHRMACGLFHSLFLSDGGDLLVCGQGDSWQLGVGSSKGGTAADTYDGEDVCTPVGLEGLRNYLNNQPIEELASESGPLLRQILRIRLQMAQRTGNKDRVMAEERLNARKSIAQTVRTGEEVKAELCINKDREIERLFRQLEQAVDDKTKLAAELVVARGLPARKSAQLEARETEITETQAKVVEARELCALLKKDLRNESLSAEDWMADIAAERQLQLLRIKNESTKLSTMQQQAKKQWMAEVHRFLFDGFFLFF
jgi:hypothetical protein